VHWGYTAEILGWILSGGFTNLPLRFMKEINTQNIRQPYQVQEDIGQFVTDLTPQGIDAAECSRFMGWKPLK